MVRPRKEAEDTLARSEIEVLRSQTAKAADQPLLDEVDTIIDALRSLRIENHWAGKIRARFQGEDPSVAGTD